MHSRPLRWRRHFTPSSSKIISHDKCDDEPPGANGSFQSAADFRFSNAWIVADGHFHDAESRKDTFQDNLNCPAVGHLFQSESAEDVCAGGPERAEVGDSDPIQKTDQTSGEVVAKRLMPWESSRDALFPEARTDRDVGTSLKDRSQENWQFSWSIAIVTVEEHNDFRAVRISQSGQTGAPVPATGFLDNPSPHLRGDFTCPVSRIAIDNKDFSDEFG